MAKQVLITGASGTLGSALVPKVVSAGHRVRAVSRQPRSGGGAEWVQANLRSEAGLNAVVAGIDVVVHCASAPRGDVAAARNLLAALAKANAAPHLIYISIAGIDRIPLGYYRAKLGVERLIAESGLPHSILRATQFHDLIVRLFQAQRRLPVLIVPSRTRFQPVDAGDVAGRLGAMVEAEPTGRVFHFGGPRVEDAPDLAHTYLRVSGRRRSLVPVHVPGKVGAGYRSGANLTPDEAGGRITFEQFLLRASTGVTD